MNSTWRAFQRLLPIWLPMVLLAVGSIGFYIWQSSGSVGRAAQIEGRIGELEEEIARLERIGGQTTAEHQHVIGLQDQFRHLYDEVFGSLDSRLVAIMRAVGEAAGQAGLRPERYGYSAQRDRALGQIRFTVAFSVDGEYGQVRKLLAGLQSSDEFLIVDDLSFGGDEFAATRKLGIRLRVSTYLSEADEDQLRRLTGGLESAEVGSDG